MKKTLIALAITASAVSGMAHAWTNSDFNGEVDFGGTITPDKSGWVWTVGQGYDHFTNKISDLTNSGKKLTIPAKQNMPLLLGKTTAAFLGGPGLAPQIAFSDSKGRITPVWASDNAEGTMTLTVSDADQKEIGTVTLDVKAIAPAAWAKVDKSSSISVRYLDNTAGALVGATGMFGETPHFAPVATILDAFGAPTLKELQDQVKAYPGLSDIAYDTSDLIASSSDDFTDAAWAYAAFYVLGIPNGKSIVVDFNSPITSEIQWKAPLMMQVSYN